MKLKWILTGIVAVVVAVIVAGYAILSTMEFEDLRGTIQAEAKKATGRDLVIAGPVDLQVSLSPAIAVEDVSFANAGWGSREAMVTLKRLEFEVALLPLVSGDIQVKRLVVVEPDILLETDAKGRANWQLDDGAAAEPQETTEDKKAAKLPSFDVIVVRNGRLHYRDGKTGEEVRVDLEELEVRAASPSSPIAFKVAGRYDDAPVEAEGTLGSFDQLFGESGYPVKVNAEAGGATIEVDGRIARPLAGAGIDVTVSARGKSLADLGAVAGTDLPPLGPYSFGAQVREEAKAFKLTGLSVGVGGSDLAGNGTLALGGERPAVRGSFTAGVLDLADFGVRESAAAAGDGRQPKGKYVFTEDPLPLDGLAALDAKLKLSVGLLRVKKGLAFSDVDLSMSLAAGRLEIAPFSAGVAGGKVAGDVMLDAGKATPPLAVNFEASDIDYGRLLKDMEVTNGVAGTLGANVGIRGAGGSLRAIAASLGGRVEIVGAEGRVENSLVQASGAGLTDMLSAWTQGDNDLRLNCIVARLPVEAGVMTSEAVLLDTAAVTVGGTGAVDLRSEELDLRVTPQAKRTSLMSLAVPFRIQGTLMEPNIGPDPVGTAVGAAKIAGLFINPLAAGAAIVLESESADQNPCVAALAQPQQVQPAAGDEPAEPKSAVEQATEGVSDAVKGVGEGITKGLKGLFGD